MKKICLVFIFLLFQNTIKSSHDAVHPVQKVNLTTIKVDSIFDQMNDEQRVAQMLVVAAGKYGRPIEQVKALVKKYKIGGVLLLNGTKVEFEKYVKDLNKITNDNHILPLLYSADAEPSLIHYKIKGVPRFKDTYNIKDVEECKQIAYDISDYLKQVGIQHNYAPVCDLSISNAAIKKRSFGSDPSRVIKMASAFMEASHQKNILTTAKHFPGHGFVKGDTHKNLVYIDGRLKELPVFEALIKSGSAPSIMVGHIAIRNNPKYNTNGMPATCSRVIVTNLLKKDLGYKGLIVTDAMGMGAVANIPHASFLAAKAGCDQILMPLDEVDFIKRVLSEMKVNPQFKEQIYTSVKKIITYKVALGML